MGETLAPAVGAEGNVKLQGEVCCTFCHLGCHRRDFCMRWVFSMYFVLLLWVHHKVMDMSRNCDDSLVAL